MAKIGTNGNQKAGAAKPMGCSPFNGRLKSTAVDVDSEQRRNTCSRMDLSFCFTLFRQCTSNNTVPSTMKDWGQLKGVTASEVSQFSLRTSCIFDAAYASDHGFKDGGGENSSLNSLHCIVIG